MSVWIAFGVGGFLGWVLGVAVMCILQISRQNGPGEQQ